MEPEFINRDGTPDEAMLARMTEAIVHAVKPRQIILFGSGARGELRAESDVDLLVVTNDDNQNNIDTTSAIYTALPSKRLPTDILVVTPQQITLNWNNPGCAIRPAVEEGRVLYDKDAGQPRDGLGRAVDRRSTPET